MKETVKPKEVRKWNTVVRKGMMTDLMIGLSLRAEELE